MSALVLGCLGATPAFAVRPELAKPIAGTPCSEFPADNWWHADVSHLPVDARSAAWLSHMDAGVDLHPDFGPSYGDGPNYGIPITVVGKKHTKTKVSFDYSSESDQGANITPHCCSRNPCQSRKRASTHAWKTVPNRAARDGGRGIGRASSRANASGSSCSLSRAVAERLLGSGTGIDVLRCQAH